MTDRLTILSALAARATITIGAARGAVQSISHEDGSGLSWLVVLQPERGAAITIWMRWLADGGLDRVSRLSC